MEYASKTSSDMRSLRAAVLNGVEPPLDVVARLEAQGLNVDETIARIQLTLAPAARAA
jgi:hypothetical protein